MYGALNGHHLAAGEGKRMKSKRQRFYTRYGQTNGRVGLSMCENSGVDEIVLVVGRNSEEVKEYMGNKVSYANQEEQLGTGHAVIQARSFLRIEKTSCYNVWRYASCYFKDHFTCS